MPGVVKLLQRLGPSKAGGPGEISTRVLKEVASETGLSPSLICHASLNTGLVPEDLRTTGREKDTGL